MWPKEVGADYLIARTGRGKERASAEALSEALGGLPLALEQAAAYCERLHVSIAEYRKRFETSPARFMDDARHAPAEYRDGATVAKTFSLAIEEAANQHAEPRSRASPWEPTVEYLVKPTFGCPRGGKTADALGLSVPPVLLATVDELIE